MQIRHLNARDTNVTIQIRKQLNNNNNCAGYKRYSPNKKTAKAARETNVTIQLKTPKAARETNVTIQIRQHKFYEIQT